MAGNDVLEIHSGRRTLAVRIKGVVLLRDAVFNRESMPLRTCGDSALSRKSAPELAPFYGYVAEGSIVLGPHEIASARQHDTASASPSFLTTSARYMAFLAG